MSRFLKSHYKLHTNNQNNTEIYYVGPQQPWHLTTKHFFLILFGVISIGTTFLHFVEIDFFQHEFLGPEFAKAYVKRNLEESLKLEKGQGCAIPKLDPFSKEITQFDVPVKKLNCNNMGADWVKCYMSTCKVQSELLIERGVHCLYQDLIYHNDYITSHSSPVLVKGDENYYLNASDHVVISCALNGSVYDKDLGTLHPSWAGVAAGIRSNVPLVNPPPGKKDGISILIVGFDSVSKNMVVRKLPKSYNYLTNNLNAVVMNGYNIVGDGTIEALFPLLTGKTWLELPEETTSSEQLKVEYFIFHHARQDGYRTLYFEDSPNMNTFQHLDKGFLTRPVDHYLRPFCIEYRAKHDRDFCVGDTPQYKMMLNLTHQFLKLDGKKFGFNFMVDLSHANFNSISLADDDLLTFLRIFKKEGHTKDTLLILMSDHGPRFLEMRGTYQGRLEERLPFMAILLPDKLKRNRPEVQAIVKSNADVLTTPFDMYATMLDAMDLTQHWNMYRVKGADLPRSVSILRPVSWPLFENRRGLVAQMLDC